MLKLKNEVDMRTETIKEIGVYICVLLILIVSLGFDYRISDYFLCFYVCLFLILLNRGNRTIRKIKNDITKIKDDRIKILKDTIKIQDDRIKFKDDRMKIQDSIIESKENIIKIQKDTIKTMR